MNEGIYTQIEKGEPIILGDKNTKENLKSFLKGLDEEYKMERRLRSKKIKQADENFKHLKNRAKELNKEIPFELMLYLCSTVTMRPVGGWFIEEFKEWL